MRKLSTKILWLLTMSKSFNELLAEIDELREEVYRKAVHLRSVAHDEHAVKRIADELKGVFNATR